MTKNISRRSAIELGLASAAAMGLAACGSSSSSTADTSSADTASSEGQGDKTYQVAMIMSGIITDGGWDQGHYESLQRAIEEHPNWTMLEPKENTADADAATAAQTYVDMGVDLIIGNGNQFSSTWAEVASEAAETNPEVHFLITNTDPSPDGGNELADFTDTTNVMTVLPNFKQTGACAGVVAGHLTQTKSIGFIAGMKLPSSKRKYSAFLAAAQKIDPEITGQYNFEAGFTDASFGTKMAEQWINSNNVDVMWGDASAVDNGVRQALEAAGADTHFDIAQPIDIVGDDQPTVVVSTITDWMIGEAMDQIEAGTFGGGAAIEANMENGGVSLGKFSDKVDASLQEEITSYLEDIAADTFITDAEVEAIENTL